MCMPWTQEINFPKLNTFETNDNATMLSIPFGHTTLFLVVSTTTVGRRWANDSAFHMPGAGHDGVHNFFCMYL